MSTQKIVLGIIGMPASGKGTVAAYLEKKHGAAKLRFSDALSIILDRLKVEKTRDHQIILSEVLRETCGEDVLSRAIQIGIGKSEANLIVVDGVRREGDIETLKAVSNFHLIGVDADPKARYERSKLREEKTNESELTFEEFQKLDERSTEITTRALMQKAEIVINNNETIDDLNKKVDDYMGAMGIEIGR
ncbi:MAG: AAA family ATPase [Patescibacteria group bacterium]